MQRHTSTLHQRREALDRLGELIDRQLEREETEAVAQPIAPAPLIEQLDLDITSEGEPADDVMDALDDILAATPRTTTNLFFNQLFAGRDDLATAADALATVTNNSMYTYKIAGPHAIIEKRLTDRLCRLVGYDTENESPEGLFAPGGSLAILSGMVMARDHAVPTYRDEGPPAQKLTLYMSAEAHYAIPKNSAMMGLGRDQVRRVPADERGRMIPAKLREAIEADRAAGHLPFLVVATAGTTVLGAYDPINEIADITEDLGLWLHIDGCYGASALLSSEHRGLLEGSGRADSFSWDAHKMMGVPLTCSVILTKRPGLMHRSFDENASYLFQSGKQSDEACLNHGTMSIQCGRRNDALKLFAAWKHHGDAGYDRRITHLFDLAQHAADIVREDDTMTLVRDPESVNVCFEVTGKSSEAICAELRRQQRAMVGYAHVGGRRIIRLALVNADATTEDLDTFFDHVREVAVGLPDADNAI